MSRADEPTAEIVAVRAIARLARFAERTLGDLSLAHYRVLSSIAAGDERASRMAAKFAVGKPSLSAAIDALSRRGLVTRGAVEDDQRASALTLTPAGQEVLAEAEHRLVTAVRELLGGRRVERRVVDALVLVAEALETEARARTATPVTTARR